jgi:hypothetical protein
MLMDKQILIEKLGKAKYWEDEFILKYDTDDFWELLKTLPQSKFTKVKKIFQENIKDTRKHKKRLEILIKNIQDRKYEI